MINKKDVSESSSFINLNHYVLSAGWGRDGIMICHYQYGRDSSWRPTHLQKAQVFSRWFLANLQYKLKQFHGKTYLKQDANTQIFFSGPNGSCYFPTKNSLNFWDSDICPVIDVDDIFTWLMFSRDSKIEIGKLFADVLHAFVQHCHRNASVFDVDAIFLILCTCTLVICKH